MQVKAADLRVGDKVIALDPALGSFLRKVLRVERVGDEVTVTLTARLGLGVLSEAPPCRVTVGAAHEITVVR